MKQVLTALTGLLVSAFGISQDSYSGTFTITAPNSSNGVIYTNNLSISISEKTNAVISFHFRGGSRTEPDDYIDIAGELKGSFVNGHLEATGMANAQMKDGKRVEQRENGFTFKGSLVSGKLEGKVYMSPVTSQEFLSFTATGGALKPELTFPVGPSPKVFNKGWKFGARFILTDEDGRETDLSDKVQWSGTASFNPATGKISSPAFNSIGENKIILTVEYQGKKYSGEYPVTTVDADKFAHVGTQAYCPSHAHGCISCPHHVIGPIIEGSPDIMINGYPAARMGDHGIAWSCCGQNDFVITDGEYDVLINGRRAAKKIGAYTLHCGVGPGQTVGNENSLLLNNSVQKNGQAFQGDGSSFSKDDEIETGENGQLTFLNGIQTMITMAPSTSMKVLENKAAQLKLLLKKGVLIAGGNTTAGKQLLIELKNLLIAPKGTRFIVNTGPAGTTVSVYHGRVTVTEKSSGKISEIDSGYYYREVNAVGEIHPLAESFEQSMKGIEAAVDNKSMQRVIVKAENEPGREEITDRGSENSVKEFLKNNIFYLAAGAAVLIVIIAFAVRSKKTRREK